MTTQNKSSNKSVYVAALMLFMSGVGYLVYSGITSGSVYFLEVSEALAMESGEAGLPTQCRMFGTVAAREIQAVEGRLGVSFLLEDQFNKAQTVPVTYTGAVPDTFEAGVEVIVEGGFDPATGTFNAATLMTKCPSKYQKDNRT